MKKILSFLLLIFLSILFSGCSTSEYVGNDYVESNIQTVKTSEDFVFKVYKKQDNNAIIKIGISKTPIMEVAVLYIQIENLSYETPYIFKVENLKISSGNEDIKFITSNNYLKIYQTQESNSMGAISSMAPTLANMTGMTTNYQDYNQSVIQNNAQEASNSIYARMEQIGNQILKHSIQVSSTISPRKSKYFYFFFENPQDILTVRYKDLNYQFKL